MYEGNCNSHETLLTTKPAPKLGEFEYFTNQNSGIRKEQSDNALA